MITPNDKVRSYVVHLLLLKRFQKLLISDPFVIGRGVAFSDSVSASVEIMVYQLLVGPYHQAVDADQNDQKGCRDQLT